MWWLPWSCLQVQTGRGPYSASSAAADPGLAPWATGSTVHLHLWRTELRNLTFHFPSHSDQSAWMEAVKVRLARFGSRRPCGPRLGSWGKSGERCWAPARPSSPNWGPSSSTLGPQLPQLQG